MVLVLGTGAVRGLCLERGLGLGIWAVVERLGLGLEFDWEILDVVGFGLGIEGFAEFGCVARSTAGFAVDRAAAVVEVAEAAVASVEALADSSATDDTELNLEDQVDFAQVILEEEPGDCRVNY